MKCLFHVNALCAAVLAMTSGAHGLLYERLQDISHNTYDFIIVGGGNAGNVIANRLSENPDVTVLVLEAGIAHTDLDVSVPRLCTYLTPKTKYDWNYTTVAQPGLDNRQLEYARGFLLGGSSSVNYLLYARGPRDDWHRLATSTGDEGWSWNSMQPYFERNEHFLFPNDGRNVTEEIDPNAHSTTGTAHVSLANFPYPIDQRIIQTTRDLPNEFPYNPEINNGSPLGIGHMVFTMGNGKRSSSATSYLAPQYINRPNLDILLHAQVSRVLPASNTQSSGFVDLTINSVEFMPQDIGNETTKLRFNTVEFATEETDSNLFTVTATKEIILSAGAIGTPQILMNSGIGNSSELLQLNIQPLVDLPSVGRNLTDHVIAVLQYVVNSTETWDVLNNITYREEQVEIWQKTHSGIMTSAVTNLVGFLRLPNKSSILEKVPDPSAGPGAPHYEFIFHNGYAGPPPPPDGNYFTLASVVLTPTSRGTVKLASADPFAHPIIDPNFFSTEFDRFTMREAFKASRRFLAGPAWSDWIIRPVHLEGEPTDDEIDAYYRQASGSIHHPVGTAAMTEVDAAYGVVDPDLRVKGVDGLRVVDASIFPFIPSGITQAPVYVVAERAADIIKSQFEL